MNVILYVHCMSCYFFYFEVINYMLVQIATSRLVQPKKYVSKTLLVLLSLQVLVTQNSVKNSICPSCLHFQHLFKIYIPAIPIIL
jgi:hypothetical protein